MDYELVKINNCFVVIGDKKAVLFDDFNEMAFAVKEYVHDMADTPFEYGGKRIDWFTDSEYTSTSTPSLFELDYIVRLTSLRESYANKSIVETYACDDEVRALYEHLSLKTSAN